MKVAEKLQLDYTGLLQQGPINIVFFGDSVTHGAEASDVIDYDQVYWQRLRRRLNAVRNYVPVNVLNAGVGGTFAEMSIDRLDRDVLSHRPDLVVVCFGLNDINGELETYVRSLRTIFRRLLDAGTDVIFMTPNMLNTYVAEDTPTQWLDYAATTARTQNEGKMDRYMDAATAAAREMGVTVCDCYARWKALAAAGEDTTLLLANRINHPTYAMHDLFAQSLFDVIMADVPTGQTADNDTMYRG